MLNFGIAFIQATYYAWLTVAVPFQNREGSSLHLQIMTVGKQLVNACLPVVEASVPLKDLVGSRQLCSERVCHHSDC